jgi:hypothetical protein
MKQSKIKKLKTEIIKEIPYFEKLIVLDEQEPCE